MSQNQLPTETAEPWRTSAYCASATCLEVAKLVGGDIGLRDSKQDSSPILPFSRSEFAAFVQGVKAGNFDDLC